MDNYKHNNQASQPRKKHVNLLYFMQILLLLENLNEVVFSASADSQRRNRLGNITQTNPATRMKFLLS